MPSDRRPNAYDLTMPRSRSSALVFASPHSGRDYPSALTRVSTLGALDLRSSEDAFLDRLFAPATEHGAPLLAARWPRAWLDLNRAESELDPALIEGLRRGPHNPRVASGLGVVPRVVSGGRAIYRGKISMAEAEARLRGIWRPYHAELRRLIAGSVETFGRAILIDCHSMPHEALDGVRIAGRRPDLVLGDRFGASAAPEIVAEVEEAFTRAGFTVSRNAPFAGAYITQAYGRPDSDRHAVQIELDRRLYMDEATLTPHGGYDELARRLDEVIADLCAIGRPAADSLAAE